MNVPSYLRKKYQQIKLSKYILLQNYQKITCRLQRKSNTYKVVRQQSKGRSNLKSMHIYIDIQKLLLNKKMTV